MSTYGDGDGGSANRQRRRSYSVGTRLSFRGIQALLRDGIGWQSRRASQDLGPSNSNSSSTKGPNKETFPWIRSKSRSVDHGIAKTSQESDLDQQQDANKVGTRKQATSSYTVADRDTLTSVAARFDTTPTELTKLNRLATPYIFPGQQLVVPQRDANETNDGGGDVDVDIDSGKPLDSLPSSMVGHSPKPGHVERVIVTPHHQSSTTLSLDDDSDSSRRFLKVNVRHITDGQGVVSGVLLVTPNAVMFDPNVSDPLVIELGPEAYGVIAPMEFVVNVAIYNDIAHMRVSGTNIKPRPLTDVEIYYPPKSVEEDESFPELSTTLTRDDNDSVDSSCTERDEGDAFPKAFDRELLTTTPTNSNPPPVVDQSEMSTVPEEEEEEQEAATPPTNGGDERRPSVLDHHWAIPSRDRGDSKESCHDSGIDIREGHFVPAATHKKMLKRLSYPLSWMDGDSGDKGTTSDGTPTTTSTSTSSSVFSKVFSSGPINFGTGLIFNKTPSEDSGGPQSANSVTTVSSMSSCTNNNNSSSGSSEPSTGGGGGSSFFPTNIISSVGASVGALGAVGRSSVGALISGKSILTDTAQKPTKTNNATTTPAAGPKLDYRSMVSVEDMPELFVSLDKLLPKPERVRNPDDDLPPMYLRLRMGKPLDRPIPRSTPLMSYGKKKMRPEYWFSVPAPRTEDLYRFWMTWVPHLYGELDEDVVHNRGYALFETDTELWPDEETTTTPSSSGGGELKELTRESWELLKAPYVKLYTIIKTQTTTLSADDEMLPMCEEYRRAFRAADLTSFDTENQPPPDLVGTTEILATEHREALCRHLPARAEGYMWTLVFSTSQHGFSLNSLYRKMYRLESPILMVIADTDNNIFGALTSCALQVSEHFYGTGESLLFRFTPELQVYNWTGENLYFIKGNNDGLSIGAGDGKFGIWLDGDLNLGRSESCKTYGNEPLTPNVDFIVKTVECWAFLSN